MIEYLNHALEGQNVIMIGVIIAGVISSYLFPPKKP
jgi:hypothetical protein